MFSCKPMVYSMAPVTRLISTLIVLSLDWLWLASQGLEGVYVFWWNLKSHSKHYCCPSLLSLLTALLAYSHLLFWMLHRYVSVLAGTSGFCKVQVEYMLVKSVQCLECRIRAVTFFWSPILFCMCSSHSLSTYLAQLAQYSY